MNYIILHSYLISINTHFIYSMHTVAVIGYDLLSEHTLLLLVKDQLTVNGSMYQTSLVRFHININE